LPSCATFAASEVAQVGRSSIRGRITRQNGHQKSQNLAWPSIRSRATWQPQCAGIRTRATWQPPNVRASELAKLGRLVAAVRCAGIRSRASWQRQHGGAVCGLIPRQFRGERSRKRARDQLRSAWSHVRRRESKSRAGPRGARSQGRDL
jgi:hypothetical protein